MQGTRASRRKNAPRETRCSSSCRSRTGRPGPEDPAGGTQHSAGPDGSAGSRPCPSARPARGPRGSGCWAGLSCLSRPGLRPAPTGPASTRHGTTPTGLTGPLGGHESPERRASHLIPAWARPRRRLGGEGGDEPRDGPTGSQPHGTEPDAHVGVAMKSDHDRKLGIRTGPFCEGGAGRCFPQVAPGSQVSRVMFQGDKAREAPGAARCARDPPLMTPPAAAQPGHTPGRGAVRPRHSAAKRPIRVCRLFLSHVLVYLLGGIRKRSWRCGGSRDGVGRQHLLHTCLGLLSTWRIRNTCQAAHSTGGGQKQPARCSSACES